MSMKTVLGALLLAFLQSSGRAFRLAGNPLGRALELVDSLGTEIQTNAGIQDRAHDNLETWCGDFVKAAEADVRTASDEKERLEADVAKAESDADEQKKAQATGDLEAATQDLANGKKFHREVHSFCRRSSDDHSDTVKARNQELSAIAVAKKTISSRLGGGTALLGISARAADSIRSADVDHHVVDLVTRLAGRQRSPALSQLASNVEAVVRLGDLTGEDVFAKVKGLLTDMLARLESESHSDTTEKAFCDEQLAKSNEQKKHLEDEVAKQSGTLDASNAHASELAEEVSDTQGELAVLARTQARLMAIHTDGQAAFATMKEVLNGGMHSVRTAMGAVNDYVDGGMRDVRGALDEVEATMASHLTAVNMEEEGFESGYDTMVQLITATKALKENDVKHITRTQASLGRSLSEASGDTRNTHEELNAVSEYQQKLQHRCVSSPDAYQERKAQREEELAGLKEALDVLNGDAVASVLLQRGTDAVQHSDDVRSLAFLTARAP